MDLKILKQLIPSKLTPKLISIETHNTDNIKLRDVWAIINKPYSRAFSFTWYKTNTTLGLIWKNAKIGIKIDQLFPKPNFKNIESPNK